MGFNELSRGSSADELIKQVVEGNDCIAILGIAAMLALETETVSDTTLPLFTSQRLLAAGAYTAAGADAAYLTWSVTANTIKNAQAFEQPTFVYAMREGKKFTVFIDKHEPDIVAKTITRKFVNATPLQISNLGLRTRK